MKHDADTVMARYKTALNQVANISIDESETNKDYESDLREISLRYQKKKWELEDKENKESNVIKKKQTELKERCQKERAPHNEIIAEMKHIFKLFSVYLYWNKVDSSLSNHFLETFKEIKGFLLDTFVSDGFKKVWVYITKNDKPVNKYTLTLRVSSVFQWHFTDYNIRGKDLKYFSSEDALRNWYFKNKKDIRWKEKYPSAGHDGRFSLNEMIEEHVSLEKDYQEVVAKWKKKAWQVLYWENQQVKYQHNSAFEEEYTRVSEMLELAKTPKKKLPLLIGAFKSNETIDELRRRLGNLTGRRIYV